MNKKKTTYYWTDEETETMLKALKATTKDEREIYWRKLIKPLNKLIENVYNMGKFYRLEAGSSREEIYTDCLGHVYMAMNNVEFNYDKSKSLFAYLQITIRNYLYFRANLQKGVPNPIQLNRARDVYKMVRYRDELSAATNIPEPEPSINGNLNDNLVKFVTDKREEYKKTSFGTYCDAVIDYLNLVPGAYRMADINRYVEHTTGMSESKIVNFSRRIFGLGKIHPRNNKKQE